MTQGQNLESGGSIQEIARRALASAGQFLKAAEQLIPGLVTLLRAGQVQEAQTTLTQFLGGLGSLARLSADLNRVDVAPQTPPVDLQELAGVLEQLVQIQERRDWEELAQYLETAFPPRLARWRQAFEDLEPR